MLPNCPLLSLYTPTLRKSKTWPLVCLEAEKSDLIFRCHRSSAFISTCFLHILFFLGHTSALPCVFPLHLSTRICVHPCFPEVRKLLTFFHLNYIIVIFFFPSVFLILVFHRYAIFHWVIIGKLLCLIFNSWYCNDNFVSRTHFFSVRLFSLTVSVTLTFCLEK